MAERRHHLLPVVGAGLASAALTAIAGNQAWAGLGGESGAGRVDSSVAGFASTLVVDATAPPVTALALVVLATWGVVLVSRGRVRRAVTWLGLVAALGALALGVSAWLTIPGALVDAAGAGAEATRSLWSYVGVLAALATAATSAVATRAVAGWPEMGRRYDAPGDAAASARTDVPVEERTNLDLWRAIDEGHDPTEGSTH